MSNTAVVGIDWGDEGKGRMVDYIASDYDIVVRFQGGNNAGHTVVNEYGKFALHLIPSGIFSKGVVNVLGNGVVVDLEGLSKEITDLKEKGISITKDNFKISERATIVFPFHKKLDSLEECRLKDKKYGSTLNGIAPVYSDKYYKKSVMVGELLRPDYLRKHLEDILSFKNLIIENVYHSTPYSLDDMLAWCNKYLEVLRPYICDTTTYLYNSQKEGKNIMFEAQLGALRDIDFGIYPYTSSSSSIAAYACLGAGIPSSHIDKTIGIIKAYSTCVGEGPFTCEIFGSEAEKLRELGQEYGATTHRPRRVGPIDIVASRYGCMIQGATELALTKMDILSSFDKIPVCSKYILDGKEVDAFPFAADLSRAKPVITYMNGWKKDISNIRRYEDLPLEAREYVEYLEKELGCKIKYISVGASRDALIIK